MMRIPTVAEKLNIRWAAVSCTVLPSSQHGLQYDRVKVLHEIGLETPLPQDENFFVPPSDRAIDTRTLFPDGNIVNFAGQRFKDLQDELLKYSQALQNRDVQTMNELHELFVATTMLSPVLFKAGTQVLTFEYEMAIYPDADRVFELNFWAPMPSFQPAGQSQITTIVQLPSVSNLAFQAKILEANGFEPDAQGNPVQEIPKVLDGDYGLRHIIAWNWQKDPFFKVKYQYIG